MTTTVTVKANHGWPVKVTALDPRTDEEIRTSGGIVEAGDTREFYIHDGMDIRVHEIQPNEQEPK